MNNGLEVKLVDLIKKIDELKSEIDKFHPLPKEVEDRIFQKYRLDWNYNSNAIEGNSLNYGETYAFLMHGITASGKPLKDYLDIRGHNEAINYLINLVRNKEELTEAIIRELHKVILVESYETDALTQNGKLTTKTVALGAYKTSPNHVKTVTGEVHYFASPEETPAKMQELMNWYRESKIDTEIHPVMLAAIFHYKFAAIHPFDDGNGRMARLLMNLILIQNNFPPAIIKIKDRNNYYLVLSQADAGDTKKFVEYVAEILINSMEIYLKGARGESIDEPDDLDKEIVLFKKEIEGRSDKIEIKKNDEILEKILNSSIIPLFKKLDQKLIHIKDLFLSTESYWANQDKAKERQLSLILGMNKKLSFFEIISGLYGKTTLRFAIALKEFKTAHNPFSVYIIIKISFTEYFYTIEYVINNEITFDELFSEKLTHNNDKKIIKNYYHNEINETQSLTFIELIKKDVFSYIKEKSK